MEKCSACGQELPKKANRDELRKVITVYKMATGYPQEDKNWDRTFFPIYLPAAKKLVDFMGSWQWAADCIQDTIESVKGWNPDAEISLQKILANHAAKWKKDKLEREAKRGVFSMPVNGNSQNVA